MVTKTQIYRRSFPRFGRSYFGVGPLPPLSLLTTFHFWNTDTVTHDGPVPDFRRKIANHVDATSSLVGTKYFIDHRPGRMLQHVFRSDLNHLLYDLSGDLVSPQLPNLPVTSFDTTADNMAIARFIQHARASQTHFQGAIFAGELGDTMRMILNAAKSFRQGLTGFLSSARSRRRGTLNHRRRALSSLWLEYSFGWKPLIADIRAGAEALAFDESLRQKYSVVTGVGLVQGNYLESLTSTNQGAISTTVQIRDWQDTSVIYRGAVVAQIDNPVYMTSRNLGFSLDNFVPTVWELIPYSFLVDYFTNIGDILSAWSFASSNFAWKNRSIRRVSNQTRETIRFIPFALLPGDKMINSYLEPCRSKAEVRTVTRGSHLGPLIPSLEFSHPEWSSLKWINLAALADQHTSLLPF